MLYICCTQEETKKPYISVRLDFVGGPHQVRYTARWKGNTGILDDTGKGDSFLTFLSDELLPQIDSTYRTLPYRILTGLFTLQTFLSATDTFQGFIAIEPSLWWDDR